MPERVTGMLLAAGRSRRFGSNKMRARLPDGNLVGIQSARTIAGAVDDFLVVVQAGDVVTREEFSAAGFETVECPDAHLGMAHSLRCGIAQREEAGAWLVALGDMPFVAPGTVAEIVRQFHRTNGIVVPRCGDRAGHPVLFPQRFGAELRALEGDVGARAVVDTHAQQVQWLETGDEGVLRDIDEPADISAPRDQGC